MGLGDAGTQGRGDAGKRGRVDVINKQHLNFALNFGGQKEGIDRFHCHKIKKNKSKTIQWIKPRNCDPFGNK